jgi:hypothetical protein
LIITAQHTPRRRGCIKNLKQDNFAPDQRESPNYRGECAAMKRFQIYRKGPCFHGPLVFECQENPGCVLKGHIVVEIIVKRRRSLVAASKATAGRRAIVTAAITARGTAA